MEIATILPEQYESSLGKLIVIKEEYDYVDTSHDEFVISNDYAQKVKEAWKKG